MSGYGPGDKYKNKLKGDGRPKKDAYKGSSKNVLGRVGNCVGERALAHRLQLFLNSSRDIDHTH